MSGTAEATACGQILYTGKLCQVPAYESQVTLKMGLVRVSWPILNFGAPTISLKRLKQESSRFIHM